ncbi:hypothetical protein BC829DRAFT_429594 [Chytridium lagenaria]|nr:hypothetical protein BC829DRAFT_429594 [Chytridium lagenaria]
MTLPLDGSLGLLTTTQQAKLSWKLHSSAPRAAYNEMSIAALQRFGLEVDAEKLPRQYTLPLPLQNPLPPRLERNTIKPSPPAPTASFGSNFHGTDGLARAPTLASDVGSVPIVSSQQPNFLQGNPFRSPDASALAIAQSRFAGDSQTSRHSPSPIDGLPSAVVSGRNSPASTSSAAPPSIVFLPRDAIMNSPKPLIRSTTASNTFPSQPPTAAMTALLIAEAQARIEAETIGDSSDEFGMSLSPPSSLRFLENAAHLETMTERSTASSAAWSWVPSIRAPIATFPKEVKKAERRIVLSPMEKRRQEQLEQAQQDDTVVNGLIGIAVSYYAAQKPNELDVYPGNTVIVFEAYQDGSGYGLNRTTMVVGLIPLKTVTFATSEEFPDGIFVPVKLSEVKTWKERRPLTKST